MCIIALQTRGAQLKDDTIRTMFSGNPDGAGIMWAQDGRVHWVKGFFKVEDLLKAWHALPKGIVAAMHCRIKTHGAVSSKLCHPFPLTASKALYKSSGDSACMLMHNGIMSFMEKDEHYDKSKDSDSSAYAKRLFDMFNGARLPDKEELEIIRDETETNNRILLLDGRGNYATSGEWEYKDGILYSNSHWKDWWGTSWNYRSGAGYYSSKSSKKKEDTSYTHGRILGGWYDDEDDWYDNYYTNDYYPYRNSVPTVTVKKEEEPGLPKNLPQILSAEEREFQERTEMRDEIAEYEGMSRCDLWGDVYDLDGNPIEMVNDSYLYTDDGETVWSFDENDELVPEDDLCIYISKSWVDDTTEDLYDIEDDVEDEDNAKEVVNGNKG